MNIRVLAAAALLATSLPAGLMAHHGWGSYDAAKPITLEGTIETSRFENPHALITVKTAERTWNVVLAPTSRMLSRGAPPEFIAVGKRVTVLGYASTVEKDEMRAERITVDGKTVELR